MYIYIIVYIHIQISHTQHARSKRSTHTVNSSERRLHAWRQREHTCGIPRRYGEPKHGVRKKSVVKLDLQHDWSNLADMGLVKLGGYGTGQTWRIWDWSNLADMGLVKLGGYRKFERAQYVYGNWDSGPLRRGWLVILCVCLYIYIYIPTCIYIYIYIYICTYVIYICVCVCLSKEGKIGFVCWQIAWATDT
jgi:hypothetical protein